MKNYLQLFSLALLLVVSASTAKADPAWMGNTWKYDVLKSSGPTNWLYLQQIAPLPVEICQGTNTYIRFQLYELNVTDQNSSSDPYHDQVMVNAIPYGSELAPRSAAATYGSPQGHNAEYTIPLYEISPSPAAGFPKDGVNMNLNVSVHGKSFPLTAVHFTCNRQ